MTAPPTNDPRQAFGQRLLSALAEANIEPRPVIIAREFNARVGTTAGRITTFAARKWLKGEAVPAQFRVGVLAAWLSVTPDWLYFGDSEKTAPARATRITEEEATLYDLSLLTPESKQLVRDLVKLMLHTRRPKNY